MNYTTPGWLRGYSAREVRDLHWLREVLEGGAAADAARAADETDIRRLRLLCDQIGGVGTVRADQSEPWSRLDREFHETIGEASGNTRLPRKLTDAHSPRPRFIEANLI